MKTGNKVKNSDAVQIIMICDIIRIYRLTAGYTQKAFAKLLAVSTSTVWKWERNRKIPSLQHCVKLASIMGMSIDALLGYERSAYPEALATLNLIRPDGSIDEARAMIVNTIADAVIMYRSPVM
jgi:transcriptional regulator with XRE-family HTH domain